MRLLWTLVKVVLALALVIPVSIIVMATVLGVFGGCPDGISPPDGSTGGPQSTSPPSRGACQSGGKPDRTMGRATFPLPRSAGLRQCPTA